VNGVDKTFCCLPCGYFCNNKSNLTKHKATKRHIDKIENLDVVEVGEYKCKSFVKTYKGLWVHRKKCKAPETTPIVTIPEVDLHAKIDNLEKMIIELAKNQQPTTINNDNSVNNTNYINMFLNDKCRNACDIRRFTAGIDFSKGNFEKLLRDYAGGNEEIITKNYNNLLECERPIYSFKLEDEHQKVVHIKHDDK
jgi:hypothetical protein